MSGGPRSLSSGPDGRTVPGCWLSDTDSAAAPAMRGRQLGVRLHDLGIYTLERLASYPADTLRHHGIRDDEFAEFIRVCSFNGVAPHASWPTHQEG